jgi:hypothetical protein
MLFNSAEFIFGFFPMTVLVFFGLVRWSRSAGTAATRRLRLGRYAGNSTRHAASGRRLARRGGRAGPLVVSSTQRFLV